MRTEGDATRTYASFPEASNDANFNVCAAEMLVNGLDASAVEVCSMKGVGEATFSSADSLGIGSAAIGYSIGAETTFGAVEIPTFLFRSISKSPT